VGPTDTAAQALPVLTQWVERGKAPNSYVTNSATRSFLLCAYPTRAVFKGGATNPRHLDVNKASNYSCQRG
jgi:hypothetical protein